MTPTHNHSRSNFLTRASILLSASMAVVAMTLVSGASAGKEKALLNVPALNSNESIVLDAAVFGSSAGQASIKAAPTTWSSRSNVRWNARWASDARYVV
jgi:hypothetical protein